MDGTSDEQVPIPIPNYWHMLKRIRICEVRQRLDLLLEPMNRTDDLGERAKKVIDAMLRIEYSRLMGLNIRNYPDWKMLPPGVVLELGLVRKASAGGNPELALRAEVHKESLAIPSLIVRNWLSWDSSPKPEGLLFLESPNFQWGAKTNRATENDLRLVWAEWIIGRFPSSRRRGSS